MVVEDLIEEILVVVVDVVVAGRIKKQEDIKVHDIFKVEAEEVVITINHTDMQVRKIEWESMENMGKKRKRNQMGRNEIEI